MPDRRAGRAEEPGRTHSSRGGSTAAACGVPTKKAEGPKTGPRAAPPAYFFFAAGFIAFPVPADATFLAAGAFSPGLLVGFASHIASAVPTASSKDPSKLKSFAGSGRSAVNPLTITIDSYALFVSLFVALNASAQPRPSSHERLVNLY